MRENKVGDSKGGTAFLREPIIKIIADMVTGENKLPPQAALEELKKTNSLFQPDSPRVGDVVDDGAKGKQKVNTLESGPDAATKEHEIQKGGPSAGGRVRGVIPKL